MNEDRILVVRLGAMGDILHALPAVGNIKKSFPHHRIDWVVAPKWMPLLTGNPIIDQVIPFERYPLRALLQSRRTLRAIQPDIAVDFQGLIQSALVARSSRPKQLYGFARGAARESLATFCYSHRVFPRARHIVDRYKELAAAAGAIVAGPDVFIPPGEGEGTLPQVPFVLTSPLAGWTSKQWPLENYEKLAQLLARDHIPLVANVPANRVSDLSQMPSVQIHTSSLNGLIDATRRAAAVLGLDSGPLHLAAALYKPGVALFGPTDPERNGPYGGSLHVLRSTDAKTTYTRGTEIHPSMRALTPEMVYQKLLDSWKGEPVRPTERPL